MSKPLVWPDIQVTHDIWLTHGVQFMYGEWAGHRFIVQADFKTGPETMRDAMRDLVKGVAE